MNKFNEKKVLETELFHYFLKSYFWRRSLTESAWIEICDACSSFLSRRVLERLRGQRKPELLISTLEEQNAIYVKSPFPTREVYVEDSNITGWL